MQLFRQSKEEKINQEYKASIDNIELDESIQSHIIELQCSLDDRGQRALACLLETATQNKYSGSAILGGWVITFKDGVVSIEKPSDPYQ